MTRDEIFEIQVRLLVVKVMYQISTSDDMWREDTLPLHAASELLMYCRSVGDPEQTLRNPVVGEAFFRLAACLGIPQADVDRVVNHG